MDKLTLFFSGIRNISNVEYQKMLIPMDNGVDTEVLVHHTMRKLGSPVSLYMNSTTGDVYDDQLCEEVVGYVAI